jgi:SAM-dependent methyltransferase
MSTPIGSFPCRFCGTDLRHTFVDLGMSPLCESYVAAEHFSEMEPFYPLHAFVCHSCYLVQVDEFVPAHAIFSEYAYFSSFADSWVDHARDYCNRMTGLFRLNENSLVAEVGSNDGYLLQHFLANRIPCYGIEPAGNVAKAAKEKGVPTRIEFFGTKTAQNLVAELGQVDLVLANNVLAQVPNLNDFVAGLKIMMKPEASLTIEFPHLLATMEGNQFDQIYHEHYCYFSLIAVERIFSHHGIQIFDIEELPTHGGSLRIMGRHFEDKNPPVNKRLVAFRDRELAAGLNRIETYAVFSEQIRETKRSALDFLIRAKRAGKSIAAYGAPGKGNTFLNYCGVRSDFIDYAVDRNPYKQGRYLPGSRIPIHHPKKISETRPDVIVILPWNVREEIAQQLSYTSEWGAQLVVLVPKPAIVTPGFSNCAANA